MKRFATAIAIIGLLSFLKITVPAAAAEPQPKASDDDAAQLKAAQDERVKVLTQLVEELTAQYRVGTADVAQVSSAERDLSNALVDSTDEPAKRVALLTKQLDKANDLLKITQSRFESGTVTHADVSRVKALCLDIKIKLLRERNGKRPLTPIPAGKQP